MVYAVIQWWEDLPDETLWRCHPGMLHLTAMKILAVVNQLRHRLRIYYRTVRALLR